jgi:hypothetical protein
VFQDVPVLYLSLSYAGLLLIRFVLIKQAYIKIPVDLIKRIFNFVFIVSVPSLLIYKHLAYDHPNSEFLLVVDVASLFVTLWLVGVDISELVFGKQEEDIIGIKKTPRSVKDSVKNKASRKSDSAMRSEVVAKNGNGNRSSNLKKDHKSTDKPRNFSMSYRHFRSSVENSFVNRVKKFLQKIRSNSRKSEVDQRNKKQRDNEGKQ